VHGGAGSHVAGSPRVEGVDVGVPGLELGPAAFGVRTRRSGMAGYSCFAAVYCRCSRSATGMFSRYQRCQFPALSPPGSSSAGRAGSNAKSTLIWDRPPEAGPQLLEVMDPAALDAVHQRPAERGSFLPQGRDRLGDLGGGGQVVLDQGGEPRGVLLGGLDAPRRTAPSSFKARLNSRDALTSCPPRNPGNRHAA